MSLQRKGRTVCLYCRNSSNYKSQPNFYTNSKQGPLLGALVLVGSWELGTLRDVACNVSKRKIRTGVPMHASVNRRFLFLPDTQPLHMNRIALSFIILLAACNNNRDPQIGNDVPA